MIICKDIQVEDYLEQIAKEHEKAKKFPPFASLHEGYAVLKEEVEEFWYEVKLTKYDDSHEALERLERTEKELIQIAAMAVKNLQLVETMKAKINKPESGISRVDLNAEGKIDRIDFSLDEIEKFQGKIL